MDMRITKLIISAIAAGMWCPAYATSPEYLALVDSAHNYMKKQRWLEAESTIISALRLEPANYTNSLLFSNLGVVRTEQGKYKDAVDAFDLGLSISPKSAPILNNRARTFMLMGNYDDALNDLGESLLSDSIQEWPLQMRGMILVSKGQLDEARHDFETLVHHYHNNDCAFAGLAKISELEGKNEDALKYYDEAISIKDDPDVRSARILLKIRMEKYSEASEDIRKSLEKYPQLPEFYVWRGYLHRLNYRNEEALADKKIALNKGADPQFVEEYIPKIGR